MLPSACRSNKLVKNEKTQGKCTLTQVRSTTYNCADDGVIPDFYMDLGRRTDEAAKMIIFDYGQTLVAEQKFDGVSGIRAVLQYATKNKYNLTAEQV